MPWVFIGGETLCYGVIFLIFLLMHVEKFGKFDHEAIVSDQMAAAAAEGRAYISALEKIRQEEGEEAYQAELKRLADAEDAEARRLSNPEKARKDAAIREEFNLLRKAHGRKEI